MAIWIDLTNSMQVWKGGIVGIIRAELEIARNVYKNNSDVRFFKFNGLFQEIKKEDISWLWECESVGDGYLTAMGRKQTAGLDNTNDANDETIASIEELRKRHPMLDNAFKFHLSRVYRLEWGLLLYANSKPDWCQGFLKGCVSLTMAPLKGISKIRTKHRLKKQQRLEKKAAQTNQNSNTYDFSFPFSDGDVIFSCGWLNSGKEEAFEKVKNKCRIFLTYLIYDTILIRENTKQFYHTIHTNDFRKYIHWVSMHCDAILYGGKTAKKDSEEYFALKNLPVPPGYPVYFGADITRSQNIDKTKWSEYKKEIGLNGDYVMAVGSMDERKNYGTLYRAFTIMADRKVKNMPQLVIVGKGGACNDLKTTMQCDPRTEKTILITSPNDEELDWLYQNAKFVLLASAWEGWSLTLPEALNYKKMVIASDVAPLREIGGSLIEYADTFDPYEWADKIEHYMNNLDELCACEKRISSEYKNISWSDCGKQISDILKGFNEKKPAEYHCLYMDITLTWITSLMGGKITGILRAELMMIKHLFCKYPNIRFFALSDVWGYISIDASCLAEIITGSQIDADFSVCREKIKNAHIMSRDYNSIQVQTSENKKIEKLRSLEDAYWFLVSTMPLKKMNKMIAYGRKKKKRLVDETVQPTMNIKDEKCDDVCVYDMPMSKGDVIFTAGTGCGKETYEKLLNTKKKLGFKYCGIIYDYTPILVPQTHRKETIDHYVPFLEFNSKMCDLILYGGATAQHDGIAYQKQHKQRIPPSDYIKFGSNISKKKEASADDDKETLKRFGIKKKYIMAVGTMEQRKNYETLYRAYLRLVDKYEDIPQLVFCGHSGWNAGEFFEIMSHDDRVKNKIIHLEPSDEELDVLYRNCMFTCLASLYEGWSLTLPESMWYKKFCICCDTPALKETAGELSEYISAWDEKKWAERMYYYYTHEGALKQREKMIEDNWHAISWEECADSVMQHLRELLDN